MRNHRALSVRFIAVLKGRLEKKFVPCVQIFVLYVISSMLQRSLRSLSGKGKTPFPTVILPLIVSLGAFTALWKAL